MKINFLKAINEAITRHDEMAECMNNMEEALEVNKTLNNSFIDYEQPVTMNDKFLDFLGLWDSLFYQEEEPTQKTK